MGSAFGFLFRQHKDSSGRQLTLCVLGVALYLWDGVSESTSGVVLQRHEDTRDVTVGECEASDMYVLGVVLCRIGRVRGSTVGFVISST